MLDAEDYRVLVELQRREDAVLTRSQFERAVGIGDGRLLDLIIGRLAERGLLVVNQRGGQDLISLTLVGRSFREG